MTDKQLLKITVLDLARLAELTGLNLQLALFPPPLRKEDIEAEKDLEATGKDGEK